ncbi:DinB family protein [Deinococcus cavernae]|uniref:DinB family protein n=1 Tax=Deinococcus cavernae TaxID=2320857 RepID=UPI002367AF49|nr:DinB family protein [Deinococcus cavernae]
MDLLDRLLGHDAWTTAALLERARTLSDAQLERARTLSDAQLDQDINVGYRTVRLTLEHIIDNMETWTDLMNGVPQRTLPAPPEQWRTPDGLHERLTRLNSLSWPAAFGRKTPGMTSRRII